MIKIKRFICGDLQENCYVVYDDSSCILIDPGFATNRLKNFLEENELQVDAIYLTHGHFDHVGGVDTFVNKYNCPCYVSKEDYALLYDPKLNCSSMMQQNLVLNSKATILDESTTIWKTHIITSILAPGHTSGCLLLIIDNHMFSGDVLFKHGVGRTDLPTGSAHQMQQTIQALQELQTNYNVYPGHGETTTLDDEKRHNPYF